MKIYEFSIYPLPDRREWVEPDHMLDDVVLPPVLKRPTGRSRKKNRDRSFSKLLSSKGKNHIVHVELQVTTDIFVGIDPEMLRLKMTNYGCSLFLSNFLILLL